jgi:hypothetical protein
MISPSILPPFTLNYSIKADYGWKESFHPSSTLPSCFKGAVEGCWELHPSVNQCVSQYNMNEWKVEGYLKFSLFIENLSTKEADYFLEGFGPFP